MAKFIEIYFHFTGQGTVRRFIINTDEIDRIEERMVKGVREFKERINS